MKRALLAVLLLPAPGRAQSVRGVCVSNCDIPTYQSSGSASESGSPSISWGRMTGRATEQVKECGSKPLCILLRASILYPIGFVFDGPYYAVKGVGYGLLYGAMGVGKAGKAIGRGIAYPFRDHPQVPPASWEAYKHQILKRQKKLAKLGPLQKETARWCKGHVPLSHGPSRAEWEGRCNPGDIVSRASLPESVRFPNAGEMMPMGLPPETPQAAAASSMAAAPIAAAAAPAALIASAPGPVSAAPPASPAADPADPSALTASASPPPATPPPAATPAPETPAAVAASPSAPAESGPGIPSALPASARPQPLDVNVVVKQGEEPAKEAAQGGFDSREPMLGAKQKETLAAFNATAAHGPRKDPDYQAAIAALSKESGATTPPQEASSNRGDGAAEEGPGGSAPTAAASGSATAEPLPKPVPHPLVVQGKARLIGDPDRFRASFVQQTGETCAYVMMRQLLTEVGVMKTEDELFYKALERGWFAVPDLCAGQPRTTSSLCGVRYDPATATCNLISDDGLSIGRSPSASICTAARYAGNSTYRGIPLLLGEVAGNTWTSQLFVPPTGLSVRKKNELGAKELQAARGEIVLALKAGKGVGVTLHGGTLWNNEKTVVHSVVVTAAVEKPNGEIVGFYINDSGNSDYARFLDRALFDAAWLADDIHRVYR